MFLSKLLTCNDHNRSSGMANGKTFNSRLFRRNSPSSVVVVVVFIVVVVVVVV